MSGLSVSNKRAEASHAYMECHGDLVRHSLLKSWDEVGRSWDEVGAKFDDCEIATKYIPEVIKYRL